MIYTPKCSPHMHCLFIIGNNCKLHDDNNLRNQSYIADTISNGYDYSYMHRLNYISNDNKKLSTLTLFSSISLCKIGFSEIYDKNAKISDYYMNIIFNKNINYEI